MKNVECRIQNADSPSGWLPSPLGGAGGGPNADPSPGWFLSPSGELEGGCPDGLPPPRGSWRGS